MPVDLCRPREAGPHSCPVARASCPVDHPYRGPLLYVLTSRIVSAAPPRVSPSSLVSTAPVMPMSSLNAFTCGGGGGGPPSGEIALGRGFYRSSLDACKPHKPINSEEDQGHLQGVLYST
eukprot:1195255-Prorocentrum_minimum.AAC.4